MLVTASMLVILASGLQQEGLACSKMMLAPFAAAARTTFSALACKDINSLAQLRTPQRDKEATALWNMIVAASRCHVCQDSATELLAIKQ